MTLCQSRAKPHKQEINLVNTQTSSPICLCNGLRYATLIPSPPALFSRFVLQQSHPWQSSGAHMYFVLMSSDTAHIPLRCPKATLLSQELCWHHPASQALWDISQTQEETTWDLQAQILYPATKSMWLSKQQALTSSTTKTLIYDKQNEAAWTYLLQTFVQSTRLYFICSFVWGFLNQSWIQARTSAPCRF